jgi:uncharacterized iron-regulated membrane protein
MKWNAPVLMRKLHRWATVLIVVPFIIVLASGLLLQVKKQFDWIQPPTQSGSPGEPSLSFEAVLEAARGVERAGIRTWTDVDRLDVRPDDGIIKVRGTNGWEVQVDAQTGAVLQVAQRRSDLIESIHDGSWFHDKAKLWIFLPSAVLVFGLWGTGVYLFYLPHGVRWRRKHRDRVEATGVKKAEMPDDVS